MGSQRVGLLAHATDQSKAGERKADAGEGEKVVGPPRKRQLLPYAKIFFFCWRGLKPRNCDDYTRIATSYSSFIAVKQKGKDANK